MASLLKRVFSKIKKGEPLIVVSGLPRSGTSMMMKMLEAGGLETVSDGIRTADDDNPKGYFEYEKVKALDKGGDKAWLQEFRGKVIKIISFLLAELPDTNNYKVIFMVRKVEEVIASQNKMLDHRGEESETADRKMMANYDLHLKKTKYLLKHAPNMEVLYVDFRAAFDDPRHLAEQANEFLGNRLDVDRMAGVVDPKLYRNRK